MDKYISRPTIDRMATSKSVLPAILTPTSDRYVLFPIKDDAIWKMYKKQVECFWRAEEIDLAHDASDWEALESDERHFISMILAFFAASDGLVLENLAARFMCDVQLAEARAFYSFQMSMENIHSETYSLLIDSYIKDPLEKTKLFQAMDEFDCISKKARWAQRWISTDTDAGCSDFATRLVAFACVEGIFFSGAFCSVFWLKKRGLMPGLTFSNELISRDEALHTEFAVLLYERLGRPLSDETIHTIVRDAVNIEIEFICDALPCRLIGMNSNMMSTYIKFVADRLCVQLGCSNIYNAKNPFEWMEMISLESKTNFFESRVSDYALAEKTRDDDVFEFDADF